MRPSFTVAPFTAVMVLLVPALTHATPIESAFYRVIEVALGGTVAIVVSFLVFPERAHGLAIEAGARLLELMAAVLGQLLEGFTRKLDAQSIQRMQDSIGEPLARISAIESEARRERLSYLSLEPDLAPLLRTLLRLRHDLVMIGRAAIVPLPDAFQVRLSGPLARFREAATDYLLRSSAALIMRRPAPALDAVGAALAEYAAAMAKLHSEGLTQTLPGETLEHIFTLGFALDQLHRNFRDLQRCVAEVSNRGTAKAR